MSENTKVFLIAVAIVVGIFGALGGYKWLHDRQVTSAQSSSSCWSAAQSWNEIGQNGCVQFSVGYTYVSSRCNAYLDQYSNYSSGFAAWIPDGCGLGETLTNEFANKTVDVSGTVTQYDGAPQIEVTSSSQVTLAN